jgi:hypothetical protein
MVLKRLHGRMKKTCGKNTHNFLSILKKTKCKAPFLVARVMEPHLRVLSNYIGGIDKIMAQSLS